MSIEKLKYIKACFDVSIMGIGIKTVTTINNEGIIVSKTYKAGSRKASFVQKEVCSLRAFQKLCSDIEKCIISANRLNMYIDDCNEKLTIFYKYGRIQTMDGGLGNSNGDIGQIVDKFLQKHLPNCGYLL